MNASSEHSVSYWHARSRQRLEFQRPSLTSDLTADVVVVGAGLTGLSTAYELVLKGRNVVVLDRGPLCGGMTSRTTAHIASMLDDLYCELIRVRGEEEARALYEGQVAATNRIEAIVRSEGIACDFQRVDGFLIGADPEDLATLENEVAACAAIGFRGVRFCDPPQGFTAPGGCLLFPNQARFDPLAYCARLIRSLEKRGVMIYGQTPVQDVTSENGRVTISLEIGRTIQANAAIIATHSPITEGPTLHSEQAPYRTYVLAFEAPSDSVPDALIWDTLDPYHYVRIQPDGGSDVVIVGGEDHRSGTETDMGARFARLEDWSRSRMPSLGKIRHRWSGQVLEPVDYEPFIGESGSYENVFFATGFSGEGMTNGVMASLILSDMVSGQNAAFASATQAQRFSIKRIGEVVRENAPVVANMAQRIVGGESRTPGSLKPGEASVLSFKGQNVAAYRDETGHLYTRSAVCTHVGCVVAWNPFERCWDCPCHGSHFAPDGSVLNAPATSPLKPVDPD